MVHPRIQVEFTPVWVLWQILCPRGPAMKRGPLEETPVLVKEGVDPLEESLIRTKGVDCPEEIPALVGANPLEGTPVRVIEGVNPLEGIEDPDRIVAIFR